MDMVDHFEKHVRLKDSESTQLHTHTAHTYTSVSTCVCLKGVEVKEAKSRKYFKNSLWWGREYLHFFSQNKQPVSIVLSNVVML